MSIENIDQVTLGQLAKAGAIQNVSVRGCAGEWVVVMKIGDETVGLALRGGKRRRLFSNLETVASHLQKFGIYQFDVDSSELEAAAPDSSQLRQRSERIPQAA